MESRNRIVSQPTASRGFTLIELLVVIAIISLLASIVMASLGSARMRARDARRKADLHDLAIAIQLYYDSNNAQWPANASSIETADGWTPAFKSQLTPYINPPPKDPVNSDYWHSYQAYRMNWGTTPEHIQCNGKYLMWTFLENPSDPDQGKYTCGWGVPHYFVILGDY